jgi:nucleotide-binding universal stress UspA family protein
MKDVLVFLSPRPGDRLSAGVHYSLSLARAHAAHLSVLVAEIEPPNQLPEPDNMHADDAPTEQSSPAERLARTAELVLSAAGSANVPCKILASGSEYISLRERVVYWAQVRDVLIVDAYGPLQQRRKDIVDAALFGSGRPLILVPQTAFQFAAHRIAIAWDATRSAVRSVRDALPLLRRARDVTVVSVVDDKAYLTPDTGDALCRYLARWNIAATFSTMDRGELNTGTALLTYARRTNADLLVMGGFAHGFERELMLGSATRDVYHTSIELPVFLSH